MKVYFTYHEIIDCDVTGVEIGFEGRHFRNFEPDVTEFETEEERVNFEPTVYANQCEMFDLPVTVEQMIASLPSEYTEFDTEI